MDKVLEAIKIFNPNKTRHKLTKEEILKEFRIFGSSGVKLIMKHFDDEVIDELINETARILLDFKEKLPVHHLLREENQKKILEKIGGKFPEVYVKIVSCKRQELIINEIKASMRETENSMKLSISAVTPESELDKAKIKAEEIFSLERIKEEYEALIEEEMKEKAIKIVSDSKKRVLDYIEAMRKTPPVKLYYYRTSSGTVSCKIKTNSYSLRYSRGMGRAIRINRGDDSAEYPLIISAHYLLDFLYKNNIDYKNILIDPQSIEVFYMFNNYTSANLTPSFIKRWWEHGCPDLFRCSVNKDGKGQNFLGQKLPHFSTKLVESSFYGDYLVNNDITEEEAEFLTRGYEDSSLYKEIYSVLEAKKMSLDELENKLKEIQEYEKWIQKAIDDNKDEIFDFLKSEFSDRIITEEPLRINDDFGFDCGFIRVLTTNPEYNKNAKLIKNSPLYNKINLGLDISFPYGSQSLTLMTKQFNKIREVVKRETGENLYCKTMYD